MKQTRVQHEAPLARPGHWRCGARRLRASFLGVLMLAAVGSALAQSDPDDAAPPIDPPGRVGRISAVTGPVEFVDLAAGSEDTAVLNWPITSGNALSTGHFGHAEVRFGSVALRLDADTDVQFPRIDDTTIQIVVVRGAVAIHPRSRDTVHDIDLGTPRERIAFDDVGRYRVDVDRVPDLTAVTTLVGYARVVAGNASFAIASGQRGEIFGYPELRFQLTQTIADAFDDWVYARDRRDDNARSAHYASAELSGIESLDDYGVWRTVPDYGPVWYPTAVVAGWAPYRFGHWAYIDPWGWTWIDDAPWGFAPFHYGRWALLGGSWAWVPGHYRDRPCYAPALVGWYGPGVRAEASGPVGWFPLAPGEVFLPGYRVSHRYLDGVNGPHFGDRDRHGDGNPPGRYAYQRNPAAATWVERDTLTAHRSIGRSLQAPPQQWLQAPVAAAPALQPPARAARVSPGIAVFPRGGGASATPAAPARDPDRAAGTPPGFEPPQRQAPGGERRNDARPAFNATPDRRMPVVPPAAVPGRPVPVPNAGGPVPGGSDRRAGDPRGAAPSGREPPIAPTPGAGAAPVYPRNPHAIGTPPPSPVVAPPAPAVHVPGPEPGRAPGPGASGGDLRERDHDRDRGRDR